MEKRNKEFCIWEKLKNDQSPVLLYGTGNGADKILDVCNKKGIKISGVFASSGFVRDRYFRDMKVKSLEDFEKEFQRKLTVLLCFGTTLDSVTENIKRIEEKHDLYVPDVPLYGNNLFDYEYYEKHFEELNEAQKLLCDERSQNLFSDIVDFRLSGKLKYIGDTENPNVSYKELVGSDCVEVAVDCGAYKGDSAQDIINALSPEKIIAIESDPKTYAKLSLYAESEKRCNVVPVFGAVGNGDGIVKINASSGRGSGIQGQTKGAKEIDVQMISLDRYIDEKIDFIKYDVEGNEREAIKGAEKIIKKYHPNMAVSVYHRSEDLFEIIKEIKRINPDNYLSLRRAKCIPAWDIVLFSSRKNPK